MKIKSYEKLKRILKKNVPLNLWLRLRSIFPSEKINQKIRSQYAKEWKLGKLNTEKNSSYPFGVNLIGYFKAANGLGEAARSTLKVFQASEILFSVHDFEEEVPINQQFDFPLDEYCNEFRYKINLIHINPLRLPYLWSFLPHNVLTDRYNIGVWYWELPEFPDVWCDAFDLVDEIWVASEFVRKSIQAKTNKPVIVIPPVIEVNYDKTLSRKDFGLPADAFLFLVAYDVLSIQERKNPEGAIEAFKAAFSPNDQSVGLVIKINNANENNNYLIQLKKELADWTNIFFVDEILPRNIFNSLLKNIDCYVSLHRSEGFGLIPAEAMYLGKPVIMTNWSGNVDFMSKDNCCPVKYELIPIKQKIGVYNKGQFWAEPNLHEAANYMKRLVKVNDYFNKISKNARMTILDLYNEVKIYSIINFRLNQINNLLEG